MIFESTSLVEEVQGGKPNPLFEQLSQGAVVVGQLLGDLVSTYPLILGVGGILSFIAGFLWVFLLSKLVGCFVWGILLGVLVLEAAVTIAFAAKGGLLSDQGVDASQYGSFLAPSGDEDNFKTAGYASAVLTIITLLLIVWMSGRIRISIGIIKEASQVLIHMKTLPLYPIWTFIAIIILLAYWCAAAAFIYTSGGVSTGDIADLASDAGVNLLTNETVSAFSYSASAEYLLWYHFFGLLWTNQFIQAIGMLTIAGCTAKYYFSSDRSAGFGATPVFDSFRMAWKYHCGSAALGSLIIAIIQLIRALLLYLEKQQEPLIKRSKLFKILFKVLQCCMWCLEKCLKFISKNAYIIVAVKGSGFCKSAKDAFFLILSNVARFAVLNTICVLLFLLAKLTIAFGCGFFMYAILEYSGSYDDLYSPVLPTFLAFLLAFFIANAFMNVYDMAIDTILVCFCMDEKENKESGNMYCSDTLKKAIGVKTDE